MWNKKTGIPSTHCSGTPPFLSTTNRFHRSEAGSLCVDTGKQCIKAGKLELLVGSLHIGVRFARLGFCSLRTAIEILPQNMCISDIPPIGKDSVFGACFDR